MENPERDQDRVEDTIDHFRRFGFIMFPEQKKIYRYIKTYMEDGSILEAGCGMGLGAYMIRADKATDKLVRNAKFAQELYPDISFDVWDISKKPYEKHDIVVCVEAIEHVKDYRRAIKNLIDSARKEVWISTPCPEKPENPPSNPYHVREFTEKEFLDLIGDYKVEIPFKGLYKICV